MVTGVAVAVGTVVHVADDVITTVTTSPLPKALFDICSLHLCQHPSHSVSTDMQVLCRHSLV
jgi:hypothetical protein